MTDPASSLRRLSRTMARVTTIGIGLMTILIGLVFVIPDWTRSFLLARLGQAGADLSLTPGHLIAGAFVTCTFSSEAGVL